MRFFITLDPELLEEAKRLTNARTKREVIEEALREFVRRRRLKKLSALAGSGLVSIASAPVLNTQETTLPNPNEDATLLRYGGNFYLSRNSLDLRRWRRVFQVQTGTLRNSPARTRSPLVQAPSTPSPAPTVCRGGFRNPSLRHLGNSCGILFLAGWVLFLILAWQMVAFAASEYRPGVEYIRAMEEGFQASFQGDSKRAIKAFERAVTLESAWPQVYYYLGMAYADEEQWNRAIEMYRKAVEREPGDVEAWFAMGFAQFNLGEWAEAVKSLSRAVELAPEHGRAYYVLGRAQNKLLQYADAEQSLKKAVERNPAQPGAFHELGMALLSQQHYEEAISYFQQAARIAPNYMQPHYGMGQAYLRLGQRDKARAEMERFQQLQHEFQEYERFARMSHNDPDNIEGWDGLARIHMRQKNFAEAIPALQECIRLDPKNPLYYHLLAQAYINLGYPDPGREAVLKAIQLEPNDANFYNTLGSSFAAQGDVRNAIEAFLKAVSLAPEVPYFHLNLSKMYDQVGDFQRAEEHYRLYEQLRGGKR